MWELMQILKVHRVIQDYESGAHQWKLQLSNEKIHNYPLKEGSTDFVQFCINSRLSIPTSLRWNIAKLLTSLETIRLVKRSGKGMATDTSVDGPGQVLRLSSVGLIGWWILKYLPRPTFCWLNSHRFNTHFVFRQNFITWHLGVHNIEFSDLSDGINILSSNVYNWELRLDITCRTPSCHKVEITLCYQCDVTDIHLLIPDTECIVVRMVLLLKLCDGQLIQESVICRLVYAWTEITKFIQM